MTDPDTERVAQAFHEAYERLAPLHDYNTRPESAVPWENVPPGNRNLMRAVARELINAGLVRRESEPKPIDFVTDLHEAVHGSVWARPDTPKAVWEELLEAVRVLAKQANQ